MKNFSKFTSVNGSAENTTIYDNSIDIIIRKSIEDVKVYFSSVQAHIIVIMPEDSNEVLKEADYAANCALIQNFQLAAWERGLGVFWKRDVYLSSQDFREEIGVKKDEKVVAILHVGYPDIISKAHPRTPIAEKVTLIGNDNLK